MPDQLIAVTITGPSDDQLTELCRVLVTERLAACANIVSGIRSLYWRDEDVQDARESLAVLHTLKENFANLGRRGAELHPYKVPQIVAAPLMATPAYGDWIINNTQQTTAP